MKITENKSKGLVKSFKVVVPTDEFKTAYDKKLAETCTKVKLPGFRPGNTPAHIVEQKYGQAMILNFQSKSKFYRKLPQSIFQKWLLTN